MTDMANTRFEGDTWDLASSVGATATMVAVARAMATEETDPLISDPFVRFAAPHPAASSRSADANCTQSQPHLGPRRPGGAAHPDESLSRERTQLIDQSGAVEAIGSLLTRAWEAGEGPAKKSKVRC